MAENNIKRYVSTNSKLMSEWDWVKNNNLNLIPETLTLGSNKKVWWKCKNGHEWQAMIGNRHRGNGCPICRKNKSSQNKVFDHNTTYS